MLKLSTDKATLPGAKQVWRRLEDDRFAGDVIGLADESPPAGAEPLLEPATPGRDTLGSARERAAAQRAALPEEHRQLASAPYPVEVSAAIEALRVAAVEELRGRS